MKPQKLTVEYYRLTEVWVEFCKMYEVVDPYFWSGIADDAPFSWGDANHTLVKVEQFRDHCYSRFATYTEWGRDFHAFLSDLDGFIDLET